MRIAFVINTMGRGGAEIQVKDYAVRLVQRGHDVMVVSLMPFEDFEGELRAQNVSIAALDLQKGRKSASALARLVRLLIQFRPDVIHAHMFAAIMAARAARACMTPAALVTGRTVPVVIGTAHSPFEQKRRRYFAYRATEHLSDLWTCVCQEGVDTHERNHALPTGTGVRTVNGIDTSAFAPNDESRALKRNELGAGDSFVWFTAGSFRNEQKDYTNLFRAFARVAEADPRARLYIAGSGTHLDAKRREVSDLGLSSRVQFLGLRSDITELLNAADAFVLGSAWEAMPIVLLEAAASGKPMVCTRVGQNADIVVEGTGFVVEPKDSDALAAAMMKVSAASEDERRRMGAAARAHVAAEFDIDVVVTAWERRYMSLLDRHSTA